MAKKKGLMRLIHGERCVALDRDGRQCRSKAVAIERYHGSEEHYGFLSDRPEMGWVRVATCAKHRDPRST